MKLLSLFSQRLYLRIWLAVVGGVAVLTLTVAWAWQIAAEQNAQNVQSASSPPSRDVAMRDADGKVIAQGRAAPARPARGGPALRDRRHGRPDLHAAHGAAPAAR